MQTGLGTSSGEQIRFLEEGGQVKGLLLTPRPEHWVHDPALLLSHLLHPSSPGEQSARPPRCVNSREPLASLVKIIRSSEAREGEELL